MGVSGRLQSHVSGLDFKGEAFLEEVKQVYTAHINRYIADPQQNSIKGKTPLLQIRGSGVFLFALVLTEGNSLEQNKRALSYEQLNTPFALSSLVLNVEISCNRFHDFILSLHFS